MSHIPNSAMPRAVAKEPKAERVTLSDRAGRIADGVRARPKTSLAAGATLIVGAVAAAAIPFLRSSSAKPKKRASARSKKTAAAKTKS